MRLLKSQTREPSVNQIIRIGMDTSKHIFQLHGVDAAEQPVLRKRLRRRQVVAFFAKLPPTVIGMEACGAAHYWARELRKLGHKVKLIAPQHVKPYVKRNKNDGRDAEGTCEAMGRPTMRFVPVKTAEQQAALMLVGIRERLIARRTQLSNAIRGYAAEFGLVAAKSLDKIAPLLAWVAQDENVPTRARPRPSIALAACPAEAQATKTCGRGARQQDCPHRLEADDDGRKLRRRADASGIGCRRLRDRPVGNFAYRLSRSCKSRTDGRIDRSEVRDSPWDPLAEEGRVVVWSSRRGNHLGQRSKVTASTGRTYGRKRSDQTVEKTLVARGPSTYGSRRSPERLGALQSADLIDRPDQVLD